MNALKLLLHRIWPVLLLLVMSLCSEPEQPKPEIISLDPNEGSVGSSVLIKGKNFSGVKSLQFGSTASYPVSKSDTEIMTVVPPGLSPGSVTVTLTSEGGASNGLLFEVLPSEPEITSLEPDKGSIGMDVTITGKYFTAASSLNFGEKVVTAFTSKTETEIRIKVPEGLEPGAIDVTVVSPGGLSAAKTFTIVGKPTITSFSPALGPVGRVVTIEGTFFEDGEVYFGTVKALFELKSATLIEATVPPSATSGKIKIITPGGEALSASDFVVKDAPAVTSFAPASGIIGSTVTITGTGFDGGGLSVKFGDGKATDVTVNSATQITAKVPAAATTGKISVETAAGTGFSTNTFSVLGAPTVASFTPVSGATGVEVTIAGTNFVDVNSVKFNGTAVASPNYTLVSATQIKAKVPAGAASGKISISTPAGSATSPNDFSVLAPPVISSFSPATGSPGNNIVITGTGFAGTTSVQFNGVEAGAGNFTVNSATQVTAKVPGSATSGKISVTNPQGSALSPTNFLVTPFIATVNPLSATVGTVITLTGTNMENATVRFNATSATPITNTAISITVAVPAGISGAVNITVLNSGGTSNGKSFTITSSVVVDEIVATENITDQLLLFRGTNLQGATKVMFGATQSSIFTSTSKVVTTKIPLSLSPGTYSVSVVTPNGTSNNKTFEVLSSQNPNTGGVSMVNGATVTSLPPGYVPPVSNQWYNTFSPNERFLISEFDNSIEFSVDFVTIATGTITFDLASNYVEFTLNGIRYAGVWTPRTTAPDGFGGTRCFAHMTVISTESGKQLELAVEYFDNCP